MSVRDTGGLAADMSGSRKTRRVEIRAPRGWDRARRALLCLALTTLVAQSLQAQEISASFPLEARVRQKLADIQELWIEWLAAVRESDIEGASTLTAQLAESAQALGMERLPELAIAAGAEAVVLAQGPDPRSAWRAIETAERLDPGRIETALAAASVARQHTGVVSALPWYARAAVRPWTTPVHQRIMLANLIQWGLAVLTLGALSFVGIEMATRGVFLVLDLAEFISRSLPVVAAYVLAVVLLVWPLLLPAGLLWLVLYWSVLLWGYGSRIERAAMILAWVFIGGLPLIVSEQAQRLDVALSAPVRAVDSVVTGRLYGSLFSDLSVARDVLQDETAFKHFEADLHLRLRQWDQAREKYREVLAAEPTNYSAMADLGASYFYGGDLDNALEYLQQAAGSPEPPAQALYSLSRVLSELYRFGESEARLRQARALDGSGVDLWLSRSANEGVVAVNGGIGRRREIKRSLDAAWRAEGAFPSPVSVWRRTLSLPLALVLVGPAVGIFLLSRRRRRRMASAVRPWFGGAAEVLRKAAMPGLAEAEDARWGRAALALGLILALVSLLFARGFSFSLPLGLDPGFGLLEMLPLAAIGLLLLTRLYKAWRAAAGGR